jgi:hypothetical protein
MVRLVFKVPTKEKPFEIETDISVVTNIEQLKQKLAEVADTTVANIKLIHKGKSALIQVEF